MSRWIYYAVLGWRDLTRLWSTTQHHIIIVTGICLPILLLLGLKRGHVESLRRDLVTSPTGRQVTFWSAREGALMNRKSVDLLTQQLPNVQLIIPETQRVVGLRSLVDGINRKVESITMFPSRNGDPLLGQFRIPVPKEGSKEIVISKAVSDQLGVRVGEEIEVVVSRGKPVESRSAPERHGRKFRRRRQSRGVPGCRG